MYKTLTLVSLLLILSAHLHAQCNQTVNAGPDQFKCTVPATFQLSGTVTGTTIATYWTPMTGLSAPNSLNTTATVSVPTTYVLHAKSIDYNTNLVTNGNFDAGNSGFTTDYTYNPNPSIPFNQLNEGQYTVGSTPAPMHINWQNCGDHTSGSGNMMLLNGATTANQNAWCQTIAVTPNTEYAFSVWVASVDPNGPCSIQFIINDSAVGSGNVALNTPCVWKNFFVLWNSGAATTATVCIRDINIQMAGNDFAIDDIVFSPTCIVTDSVTVTPYLLMPTAMNNSAICVGQTLQLTADGGNTYQWSGPNSFSQSGQNVSISNVTNPAAGLYEVTVTGPGGCSDTATTLVTLWQPSLLNIAQGSCDTAAVGVFTQHLTNQFGCDSTIISTVTLLPSNLTNLSATTCDTAAAGIFTQMLTNHFGCDSTIITTVTLLPSNLTNLSATTCDPTATGIFTQNLTNQFGCDSTVITTVSLSPQNTVNLTAITCDPAATGVFTQNLTNQLGCDSTVITTVTLSPSSTVNLTAKTCDPTATGIFTQNLTNQFGCDSTVITTVTLSPSSTVNLTAKTCDPAATGVFTQILTNQFDCDSTVITTVTLSPTSTVNLTAKTCDPAATGIFTQVLTNQFGCDSTVITTVTLSPTSTVNLTAKTCDPAATGIFTQVLTNQFGCDSTIITTISLSPSSTVNLTAKTCDPAATGIFTQVLTNQFGCDSTIITTVTLLPQSTVNLAAQTCNGVEVGVFTQNLTNQFGCDSTVITTITLLPGNVVNLASATCNPAMAGIFTQNLTAQSGCDSTVVTTVTLLPSPMVMGVAANFNGFGVPCAGGSEGSASAMVSGGLPPFQYSWSNGASSPGIDHLAAGIYSVTCVDANGCSASSQVALMAPPPLQIGFEVNHLDCFGHDDGVILAKPLGGAMPLSFSMNGGPFQHSGTFTGLPTGQFTVTARDANGCTVAETVVVNGLAQVNVQLGSELTIEFGDSVTLQALVNVPLDSIVSVVWSLGGPDCTNCLSQQIVPFVTTAYTVGVTTVGGCHAEDTQLIKVNRTRHVYIPNVFSPNDDGQNDVFLIFAKEREVKTIRSFLGFSRWGEQVWVFHDFQPNDPDFGWDGSFRGQKMDPAVFVWFAELEFIDGSTAFYSGDVTLVR